MAAHDDILANCFLRTAGIAAVVVDAAGRLRADEVASIKLGRGEIAFCCRRGQEQDLLAAVDDVAGSQAECLAYLRGAARRLRIQLTDHAALIERARAYIAGINEKLDQMQKAGDLRSFNQEFKARRQLEPALKYSDFVHAKKIVMVEAVARQLV